MDAIKVILKNFAWSDQYDVNSFVGKLHECSAWDYDEYWSLECALFELIADPNKCFELHWPIFRIFSYTIVILCSHFNQNEFFKIVNLTDEEVFDFRERFQLVFEGFFSGKMPNLKDCFEMLNPKING